MSSNYTPWERVQISRSAERPTSLDYISTIFERYMSLHGDRYFGDDKAIAQPKKISNEILECHHQKDTENP